MEAITLSRKRYEDNSLTQLHYILQEKAHPMSDDKQVIFPCQVFQRRIKVQENKY